MLKSLFRKKTISQQLTDLDNQTHENKLSKKLNWLDLTALGIGAVIGTGIFVLTGTAAAGSETHMGAGPALILSFVVTGIACGLAALCYAEFASMMPISGSAYTYSYASFGEMIAWIMGWCLVLEYAIGNIAVSIGWSGYFCDLLRGFNIHFPDWLITDYVTAKTKLVYGGSMTVLQSAPIVFGIPFVINLPAMLINFLITIVLVIGVKESSWVNIVFVALKLVMVFLFIFVGFSYVKPEFWGHDWATFAPNGFSGVMTGAALIFFAYIGFDAISTAAEETVNPKKDMPRAIIVSLVVITILYVIVTMILTGIVDYKTLNVPEPVSFALRAVGENTVAGIISAGAVISMTSVLFVFALGQPRIFFSMSRDGLLPPAMGKIHPRFKTPHISTILTGLFVGVFSGFMDIGAAADLTNIGTLIAFILVSLGVLIKRYTEPNLERPFRTPFIHFVAPAAILICGYISLSLPAVTWHMFFVWLVIGLLIYFSYGYRKSKLNV